jgi:hypothetical protein
MPSKRVGLPVTYPLSSMPFISGPFPLQQYRKRNEAINSSEYDPIFIFRANLLIDSHVVPTWITDKAGKRTQERVWNDLLKILDSSGHSVDITALKAGKKGVATV